MYHSKTRLTHCEFPYMKILHREIPYRKKWRHFCPWGGKFTVAWVWFLPANMTIPAEFSILLSEEFFWNFIKKNKHFTYPKKIYRCTKINCLYWTENIGCQCWDWGRRNINLKNRHVESGPSLAIKKQIKWMLSVI